MDNICGFCKAVGVRANIKVTRVHRVSECNRWAQVLALTLYMGNRAAAGQRKLPDLVEEEPESRSFYVITPRQETTISSTHLTHTRSNISSLRR
ncbi:unnamed protein product [Pleuronectes platessa]|uniref:Uncharacterized protein n=1 Tax=Pleuronectes platessa TaxID=8262 RepID=A0A9N7VKD3_PLEPL|nr:unnamed protein product [Pleuronectes platessa]